MDGNFGPKMKATVLYLHHQGRMTQPLLKDLLNECEIDISFWHYLLDRIQGDQAIPPLSVLDLISHEQLSSTSSAQSDHRCHSVVFRATLERKIHLIGVKFSRKKRNVVGFAVELA